MRPMLDSDLDDPRRRTRPLRRIILFLRGTSLLRGTSRDISGRTIVSVIDCSWTSQEFGRRPPTPDSALTLERHHRDMHRLQPRRVNNLAIVVIVDARVSHVVEPTPANRAGGWRAH